MDFRALPKIELHCHLDGSLSLDAIRQLASWASQDIPETDMELQKLVTAPQDVSSLNEYLKTFDFVIFASVDEKVNLLEKLRRGYSIYF